MDGLIVFFFFSSRRRHTRFDCDWSSDVCSSDLVLVQWADLAGARGVTLWLAWCSVMLVEAILGSGEQGAGSGTFRWRPGVAVLGTVFLAWGYGAWRARTLPIRELGTVGLIQPNEGFREKWDP